MNSELNHPGLRTQYDGNEIMLEGVAPFDMFVRLAFETGICGEGWSDYYFCEAGTNIDDWSWELAKEHAESYGHYEDEYDEETGFDPSDISATVYWYSPEVSSARINGGSPNSSIHSQLVHSGIILPSGVDPVIYQLLYFENDGELRCFLAHK